jgi:hypothetical protein
MPSSNADGHRARPDRAALAAWLASPAVVTPDGAVLSWVNPAHPGFPYPEAAGWWLAWAAWRRGRDEAGPADAQVRAVAGRLASELECAQGIGKSGRTYLFDTCVAARGLARAAADRAAGWCDTRWVAAVTRGLQAFLGAEACVLPGQDLTAAGAEPATEAGAGRWSRKWGPHLERAAGLLEQAAGLADQPEWQGYAARLRALAAERGDELWSEYTHARLYAAEAAWAGDVRRSLPLAEARLARVARAQRADGALPAWLNGDGPARADATAQAARLWLALGRGAGAAGTARALAWLAAQQSADGGLPYEAGLSDRNTWAAIFADQAVAWAETGVEPGGLV